MSFHQKALFIENSDGHTPLMLACQKGDPEVISLLLEKNPDLKSTSKLGLTALHIASKVGATDIVDLLLEKGAEINAVTTSGHTPLSLAVESEHVEVVELLLRRCAQRNLQTYLGDTALHIAVKIGNKKLTSLLLENTGGCFDPRSELSHETDFKINQSQGKNIVSPKPFPKLTCEEVVQMTEPGEDRTVLLHSDRCKSLFILCGNDLRDAHRNFSDLGLTYFQTCNAIDFSYQVMMAFSIKRVIEIYKERIAPRTKMTLEYHLENEKSDDMTLSWLRGIDFSDYGQRLFIEKRLTGIGTYEALRRLKRLVFEGITDEYIEVKDVN